MTRRLEMMSLATLTGASRNPKRHANEAISTSIGRFGYVEPIVLDERTGRLVAGHGRMQALRASKVAGQSPPQGVEVREGEWLVPVLRGWASRSDTEAQAYLVASNNLTTKGGWDNGELGALLKELAAQQALDGTGFDAAAIEAVMKAAAGETEKTEGKTDPDELPAAPPSVAQSGDIFELGRHRLMCGDSTSEEAVARLIAGAKVDLVLTDPPYGLGSADTQKNAYDVFVDTRDNLQKLIAGFLPIARKVAPRVVLSPGTSNLWLYPEPTWTLCWLTLTASGRTPWGFGSWQPLLCYGNDPRLANGEGAHPDVIKGVTGTVDQHKSLHPCPKPVASWVAILERVGTPTDVMFEPFSGSGTTLITAEKTGHTCYAMELSPTYVDIAVARWEAFTGLKAVKIG